MSCGCIDTQIIKCVLDCIFRVGLKKDVHDQRTSSLLHIITLLPELRSLQYVLVENVKGFESSESRNLLKEALENQQFTIQEFLLNPMQFGIPNSRLRYYLLAKRRPLEFCFQVQNAMVSYVRYTQRTFSLTVKLY